MDASGSMQVVAIGGLLVTFCNRDSSRKTSSGQWPVCAHVVSLQNQGTGPYTYTMVQFHAVSFSALDVLGCTGHSFREYRCESDTVENIGPDL